MVFNYVDGALYVDTEDKFTLVAFRDKDVYEKTMEDVDYKEFQFTRKTWEDVYSDFRGKFTFS